MEKSVLVVDDSIFVHEEIRYLLKGSNYRISGYAKDGKQAIKMYDEMDVKPDVVVMDIIMPGMNGLDTSKLILDKWNDAKIIIVSSLAYDDTLEKAEEAGVAGFIFKPLEKDAFLNALDEATADSGK